MDIHACYQEILSQLKREQRPRLNLSQEEVTALLAEWNAVFPSIDKLRPLLAIFNHSHKEYPQFQPLLLEALKNLKEKEILIFSLSAFQKHVVELHQKRGLRFSKEILKSLECVLHHPHPHVFEWGLRVVEQLGPQKFFFKALLIKRQPHFFQSFLPQQKVIKHLIAMVLETKKEK